MKISKKPKTQSVKANEIIPSSLVAPSAEIPNTTVVGPVAEIQVQTDCPFTQAKDFIQSAINSLATVAGESQIAKDSIANLAVVLMDLQSC